MAEYTNVIDSSDSAADVEETFADGTVVDTTIADTTVVDSTIVISADALGEAIVPESAAVDAYDEGGGALGCDGTGAPASEGTLDVNASLDFEPLCGGVILLGDRTENRIARLRLADGSVLASYPLTAAPYSLALDEKRSLLYASFFPATKLARVNLVSGSVTYVPLSRAAKNITLGPDGQVLALDVDGSHLLVIDGLTATQIDTKTPAPSSGAGLLAFVPSSNTLFLSRVGYSPSEFIRYTYDPSASALVVRERSSLCTNGRELAVSPDGARLALACGGGNGTGYTIYDFSSSDFTSWAGEWATGPYPTGAAFSPDGTRFGATNGKVLQLFDATTHALTKSSTIAVCSTSFDHVRFSRDGKLLIGSNDCGKPSGARQLAWVPVP
jgi:hypothetical protein